MNRKSINIHRSFNATCIAGTVTEVLLMFFALINIFRGMPIWALGVVFFFSNGALERSLNERGSNTYFAYDIVCGLICFILYFVFK